MHRWRGLLGGLPAVALVLLGGAPAVAADGEVDIPDPVFRGCMQDALEGRPLTAENLASLTQALYCSHQQPAVTDLTGAEYLTGLRGLVVRGNAISDLSPVSKLPNLLSLWFDGNQVVDLAPLAGMGLLSVGVGANPVATLAPLATLPALKSVQLQGGSDADLDPLAQIPSLQILTVQGRPADGYTALHSLAGLASLSVSDDGLQSLDELSLPAGLRSLFVQSSGLESLAGVDAAPGLTSLSVSNGSVSDLTPLQPLAKLALLNIHQGAVDDLGALSGKSDLKTLTITSNDITDLTPLAGLTALTSLDLSGNEITDITPLAGLDTLTSLRLDANQITDFSPLNGWAGELSALNQWIQLPPVKLDTPTAVALRAVDGSFLSPSEPNSPCSYADGMMTCTARPGVVVGGQFLFHSGPTADASAISVTVSIDVTGHNFSATTPLPAPGGGSVQVGKPVTAPKASWSPSPTHLSYRWTDIGGRPIPGATSATYTPTGREGGGLAVSVTAYRPTYFPATEYSMAASVLPGSFSATPTPRISYSGRLATDTVLTANPGVWQPAATLRFQWQQNNADIPGATSATYKLRSSAVGEKVRVRVTATRPGYSSQSRYSTAVTPAKAVFPNHAPVIRGTRAVGKTLTAQTRWPAGTTLKYQWYRNSKAISGATKPAYTLKASDLGDRFKVRVTASRVGYATLVKTSATTSKVTRGALTTARVSVKGTAAPGRTLTAIRGTWGPGSVRYSYRWYRDGKPIAGATGKRYVVKKSDRGHAIKVRVTVTKSGYTTVRKSSPALRVS